MSMSEMPAGSRYIKLVFSEEELNAIRAACSAVAKREHYLMMNGPVDVDLETAANQAKRAGDAEMADGLASMFKPDQQILIDREDLALVLESLKVYGRSPPEEYAEAVERLIEKIERSARQ